MTDTERLDFLEKHKLEIIYYNHSQEYSVATFTIGSGYFQWAINTDLRTAIDEAMAEMRGFNNAPTN